MAPKPGGIARLEGEAFHIVSARSEPGATSSAEPGTARLGAAPDDAPLRIATGDGWLVPLVVQRPGSRAMDTATFLHGRPIADGTLLGDGG